MHSAHEPCWVWFDSPRTSPGSNPGPTPPPGGLLSRGTGEETGPEMKVTTGPGLPGTFLVSAQTLGTRDSQPPHPDLAAGTEQSQGGALLFLT